jgi:peptidoglycan/xylan/chitin deacetylase (PgdA/CDA1 family)
MLGIGKAQRLWRAATEQFADKALVLLYHRVATLPRDPWHLAVSEDSFVEHLSIVRRYARPVPLGVLSEEHRSGSIRPGTVALTFDDGYADAVDAALPLLEKFDVPATFFVTSGFVDRHEEVWSDELEYLMLDATPGIDPLRLRIQGRDTTWGGGEDRLDSYRRLCAVIRRLPPDERCAILEAVRRWAGQREPSRRWSHRLLTSAQLGVLTEHPLAEIGGHGHTHTQLSAMTPADQQRDVAINKQMLEDLCGTRITGFSYPYGGPQDFTDTTRDIVCAAGFTHACTSSGGVVTRRTDPLCLPRIYLGETGPDEFAVMLRRRLGLRIG